MTRESSLGVEFVCDGGEVGGVDGGVGDGRRRCDEVLRLVRPAAAVVKNLPRLERVLEAPARPVHELATDVPPLPTRHVRVPAFF